MPSAVSVSSRVTDGISPASNLLPQVSEVGHLPRLRGEKRDGIDVDFDFDVDIARSAGVRSAGCADGAAARAGGAGGVPPRGQHGVPQVCDPPACSKIYGHFFLSGLPVLRPATYSAVACHTPPVLRVVLSLRRQTLNGDD